MAPPGQSLWQKRILIPFWILQSLLLAGLFSWLGLLCTRQGSLAPINLVPLMFCAVSFLLSLTEIILFVKSNLQPLTYLIFQVLNTSFYLAFLILVVVWQSDNEDVGWWTPTDGLVSWMTLYTIIAAVVLLFHIAILIYASVTYHRYRQGPPHRRISLIQLRGFNPREPYFTIRRGGNAGMAVDF